MLPQLRRRLAAGAALSLLLCLAPGLAGATAAPGPHRVSPGEIALRALRGADEALAVALAPPGVRSEQVVAVRFDAASEHSGSASAAPPGGNAASDEPPGVLDQNRLLVVATLLVLGVLTALVLALSLAILRRKRAEAQLRDSEEKYRQIFNTESDAIIVFDAETQNILDANEAALRLYGYGREEFLRLKSTDLSAEPERSRAFIRQVRGAKFGRVSLRRHRARDGREIPVELAMSAFTLKDRAVCVAVMRDITDRLQIEDELRLSETRFRDFAASASDFYWEMDAQLRFSFFSERFTEITGVPQSALLGRTREETGNPGADDAAWRGHLATLAAHRPFRNFVHPRTRPDGAVVYVAVNGQPVFDADGNFTGYRGTAADITEAKRAEDELNTYRYHLEELVAARTAALEAANRELESFSYSVSHDLRSPLRAIDGFSHAVLDDYGEALDERARSYLGRVRAASQRMGQLIDGLLELSRLTRRTLRADEVDLSALAREVTAALAEGEPARSVEVSVAPGLSCQGDRRLLRVVLENLLGNAWKYTAHCEKARVEFDRRFDEHGNAVYFVRDNGVGFDMRYVHKLFGEFQRLHGHGEYSGTGIGLATVARIVRRHGGEVWAEAVPDEGATFHFTLGVVLVAQVPA